MDDQKIERMLAKAAARAIERGHRPDKESRAPKPKRPVRVPGGGRDVDALLDRLRTGRKRGRSAHGL